MGFSTDIWCRLNLNSLTGCSHHHKRFFFITYMYSLKSNILNELDKPIFSKIQGLNQKFFERSIKVSVILGNPLRTYTDLSKCGKLISNSPIFTFAMQKTNQNLKSRYSHYFFFISSQKSNVYVKIQISSLSLLHGRGII